MLSQFGFAHSQLENNEDKGAGERHIQRYQREIDGAFDAVTEAETRGESKIILSFSQDESAKRVHSALQLIGYSCSEIENCKGGRINGFSLDRYAVFDVRWD